MSEVVIYKAKDGHIELSVNLTDDTVWLTLNQISDLFARDKSVISRHLTNIFKGQELDKDSVVANFATTAVDGKTYQVTYYNLDVIISLGYRVNSKEGVQFRQWAMHVLKEHIIKGYTVHKKRITEQGIKELQQSIDCFKKHLYNINWLMILVLKQFSLLSVIQRHGIYY
ncbi:MAG: virulence RhuM family protein [Gammaproteobacteria bacterium]